MKPVNVKRPWVRPPLILEASSRAFAEMWGAGWLRVPEWGSRPCWNR